MSRNNKFRKGGSLGNLTLTPEQAARLKSDSKPVVFSEMDLRDILGDQSRHLSYTPPLDFLNISTVRSCMNEALRGAYAQVQWIWEQLEPADAVLASCVEKRDTALKKLPWRVVKKKGLSDLEDAIADAQLRTVKDFCNAISNMDEAIAAFGQASFRHFRRLQMVETSREFILQVTDNWNWSRDGYNGEWQWNPRATFGTARAEAVPVPEWSILTRFCPRPIDQVAMMLCLDRKNAKAQWMTCNGRYGTPPFFVVLPEGTDEDTKILYLKMAMQCVSNSCGTLPPGADVKAVSVPASTPDMFLKLIDLSTQELVLRSTNGQMTMLTAPGAGTNTETGSTHEDGFDDLAAAEGKDISGVLNRGMVRPIIEQWHPGQEIYVELEIKHPEADDTVASVNNIAQLASVGYRAPDDVVTESTGIEVSSANMDPTALYAVKSVGYRPEMTSLEQRVGMPLEDVPGVQDGSSILMDMHSRYAPTMLWPAAREVFDRTCFYRAAALRRDYNSRAQEPALSRDELDALSRMAGVPGVEEVTRLAETLQAPLKAALDAEAQDGPQGPGNPVATPLQIANTGDDDEERDTNGKMSRSEAARHAAWVRWGKEGRIGRNRGIGREGEGKSTRSNTPLKAGKNATTSEQVDAVEKAITKTARKGGSVKTGVKIGKRELVVDGGHKDYAGTKHAQRHFKPGETTPRKAATTIVTAERKKQVIKKSDGTKDVRTLASGRGSQKAALANGAKKGEVKIITAWKDKKRNKEK